MYGFSRQPHHAKTGTTMFALTKTDGTWVTSTRTGHRLTWTSRQLARMAAKALTGTYGHLQIVDA